MTAEEIIAALLPFAKHKYDCDSLQPMWHKGPCDCGFAALVVKLRAQGVDIIDGSFYEDTPQPPLGEKPALVVCFSQIELTLLRKVMKIGEFAHKGYSLTDEESELMGEIETKLKGGV